jgi:hypothetical protein
MCGGHVQYHTYGYNASQHHFRMACPPYLPCGQYVFQLSLSILRYAMSPIVPVRCRRWTGST